MQQNQLFDGMVPLPNTTIIGFGHRARNGKDTAVRTLCEKYPTSARRFAFADALYDVCRVVYGMTTKNSKLLQDVGEEGRQTDPAVWIRPVYYKVLEAAPRFALLSDMRHINEAAFVKHLGGYTVKVVRLNEDGSPFIATDRDPNHPSETGLADYDGWDYVIEASSPQELERKTLEMFTAIQDNGLLGYHYRRMKAVGR